MSIIQGNSKVSAGGYTIDQSILFNDNDSAYLSRTSGSADSERKFASVSMWLKRCNLTSRQNFYSVNGAGSTGASNQISMAFENSGTNGDSITYNNGAVNRQSTSVYRDVSGWYHFVQIFDTTQATAADRVKTYINGVLLTDLNIGQDFSLNSNTAFGQSGVLHYIGRRDSGFYYDGYMAEIVFTVGQSVAVTNFGETNDDGVWVPKAYAGTYGTNGFYLKGQDSSNLGDDSSGNGNDFTSSGLTASDQMPDSPTNNYGTLNPLTGVNSGSSVVTQANGNLEATQTANYVGTFGTVAANSGKYYFEYSYAADGNYGDGRLLGGVVCVETADHGHFRIDGGSFYYPDKTTEGNYMVFHRSGNGQQSNTGTSTSAYNTNLSSSSATGGPESGPDIYMVAMDLDNDNLYWGKNGTWYGASSTSGSDYTDATPIAILSAHQGKYFAPAFYWSGAASGTTTVLNCGQDATFGGRYSSPAGDFYYTPPTGFSKLSTANLPTPAIADGLAYSQTTLYTGNGSATQTITQSENSTFNPDFIWIKNRSNAYAHNVNDAVRGYTGASPATAADVKVLASNATDREGLGDTLTTAQQRGFVQASTANGFIVNKGTAGSQDGFYTNASGHTYVAWQWLAANGTASNTNGSITSTVSANTTAGFSIAGYTGNAAASATIGHGLNEAPQFYVVKRRDSTGNWVVYSEGIGATNYLLLDSIAASTANPVWNDTAPTSTVFSVNNNAGVNGSGNTYIAYCWHSVEGFSKFGKYTGNGSLDGPFVWCGFRPSFLMVKRTDVSSDWFMLDNQRPGYNVIGGGGVGQLAANQTYAESSLSTYAIVDFLSNGFKVRHDMTYGYWNASGGTYIFMAFAEHPFGGDGVAPVPAR
jgi:hypothetical protein